MPERRRFNELDGVRVVRLLRLDRSYSGTGDVARPPRIGDSGTIVLAYPDPSAPYCVESVDDEGRTIWLADFDADEVVPIRARDEYRGRRARNRGRRITRFVSHGS
jgi:hypothetical protein